MIEASMGNARHMDRVAEALIIQHPRTDFHESWDAWSETLGKEKGKNKYRSVRRGGFTSSWSQSKSKGEGKRRCAECGVNDSRRRRGGTRRRPPSIQRPR